MARPLGSLDDVITIARPVVERIVWCTVATAGPDGPRTRLMHPVWTWDGSPSALVTSRPTALKRRHLAHDARVSCSYWDPAHATVTIDAVAAWVPVEDRAEAWEQVRSTPAPVGFDPAMIWPDGPGSPDCAFLRLTARRIVATPAGAPGVRWEGVLDAAH